MLETTVMLPMMMIMQ